MAFSSLTRRSFLAPTLACFLLFACQLASVSAQVFNCVGGSVYVIAHPDDDLLFQSPDLYDDVTSGACITTVFLTAGDSGIGSAYSMSRFSGNEASYALMLGAQDVYTEFNATFGGQAVMVRTLASQPQIQKVYFLLPDGGLEGEGYAVTGYQSLRELYFGDIGSITSQPGTATYTMATLKQALSQILTARQPNRVRTLDYMSAFDSGDHSDHYTTARITASLVGTYAAGASLQGYMGYPVSTMPPTMAPGTAKLQAKLNAFFAYTPYDPAECQSWDVCVNNNRGESYWLRRQYVVNADIATTDVIGGAAFPVDLPTIPNIALLASVSASSASSTQPAQRMIDGVISGYPGNASSEWSSVNGGAGTTATLTWTTPYTVSAIALYDRPNHNDWILSGTLTFTDGSSQDFTALNNDGSATLFKLDNPVVTTSVMMTVTGVSGATGNVGLSEFQVYGVPCVGCSVTNNTAAPSITGLVNLAITGTATASSFNGQQRPAKAIDGFALGYPQDWTLEWSSDDEGEGAWLNIAWRRQYSINKVAIYDRPNMNDWITGATLSFSDGSSYKLPNGLNNNGSATVFDFPTVNTTFIKFTVDSVGPNTGACGLAEFRAFYTGVQPAASDFAAQVVASATATASAAIGTPTIFPTTNDLALSSTVTASSEGDIQPATSAIDGWVGGYTEDGTNVATEEWASRGEGVGAWIVLTWTKPITVAMVVLYDRPNLSDQILAGTLTFSDGTVVTVPALDNRGSATPIILTTPLTTTSIKLTVTKVSTKTGNVGLSEFSVYGPDALPSSAISGAVASATSGLASGVSVVASGISSYASGVASYAQSGASAIASGASSLLANATSSVNASSIAASAVPTAFPSNASSALFGASSVVANATSGIASGASAIASGASSLLADASSAINASSVAASAVPTALPSGASSIVSGASSVIAGASSGFASGASAIASGASSILANASSVVDASSVAASAVPTALPSGASSIVSGASSILANATSGLASGVSSVASSASDAFANATSVVASGASSVASGASSAFSGAASNVASGASSAISAASSAVSGAPSAVQSGAASVQSAASSMVSGVASGASSVASGVASNQSSVISAASSIVSVVPSAISSQASSILASASAALSAAPTAASSGASSIVSAVSSGATALSSNVVSAASSVQSGASSVLSAASSGVSAVPSAVSSVPSGVKSGASSILSVASSLVVSVLPSKASSSILSSSSIVSSALPSSSIRASSTSTSSAPAASCTGNFAYGQCGGATWLGSKCCPAGYQCQYSNDFYSQCVPVPPPCANSVGSQCGGFLFYGTSCCPTGSTCTYSDLFTSVCKSTGSTATSAAAPVPTSSSVARSSSSSVTPAVSSTKPASSITATSAAASATISGKVYSNAAWKYTNCRSDLVNSARSLPNALITTLDTVDACLAVCETRGYALCGLSYAGECYGGNAISPLSTVLPATSCQMKCADNTSQLCGGSNALDVYTSTKRAVLTLPTNPYLGTYAGFTYSNTCKQDMVLGLRTLPLLITGVPQTIEACLTAASARKATAVGLSYYGECWYADALLNKMRTTPTLPATSCQFPCADNPLEWCGGDRALSVYYRTV